MRVAARVVLVLALLGAAAAAGYWHWSPYLAMSSMKAAAKARDAAAFNRFVDYPSLRESLKGQLAAQMADAVDAEPQGSDAGRAGAALGLLLGNALMERMVDALVRPETIMRAMSRGQLQPPSSEADEAAKSPEAQHVDWVVRRQGFDQVVAHVRGAGDGTKSAEEGAGFVFQRSGFATWRLAEVRLPAAR